MGWVIAYSMMLGWMIGKVNWREVLAPMDCTHAWENDHCYVCGEDR
jgi:hypothetical protein